MYVFICLVFFLCVERRNVFQSNFDVFCDKTCSIRIESLKKIMHILIVSLFLISALLLSSASPICLNVIKVLNLEEIKNCELDYIIKYSKTKENFYGENFKKYPDVQYEQALCDSYINRSLDEYYESLAVIYKTSKDAFVSNNTNFIINSMKKRNFSYVIEILFITSDTLPSLSTSKLREMMQNIERSMVKRVLSIVNKNSQDDTQSEYFESLVEPKDQDLIIEKVTMHCWKINLIAKGFLDGATFNVTNDPLLLDITDKLCSKYIKTSKIVKIAELLELIEPVFEDISANTISCIEKFIEKHQMIEVATRVTILANNDDYYFTDEQTNSEKRAFMKKIKWLYADIESNC